MEGTSAEPLPERASETEKAVNLIVQGRRNVICGEISMAVQQFQDACQLLSKHYGETAKECAEAYFCYGKALLELARIDTGVLGEGIEEKMEEDQEKEENGDTEEKKEENGDRPTEQTEENGENKDKEEKPESKEEKPETNGDSTDKGTEEKTDEKKEDSTTTTDEKKDDTKKDETTEKDSSAPAAEAEEKMETAEDDKTAEKKTDEEKPKDETETKDGDKDEQAEGDKDDENGDEGDENEDDEDDNDEEDGEKIDENGEDEEDVSNLQLAWEMLELAKLIYLKGEAKAEQLAAAQCFSKLGEVGLESEQFEQAVADFKECLKLQEAHLEPDDRLLAETHYQLGLAHGLAKLFEDSVKHYHMAHKILTGRIEHLKQQLKDKDEDENKENDSTDRSAIDQEIKDLEEILPDIKSKIDETEEDKKGIEQMKEIAKDALLGERMGNGEEKNSTEIGKSVLGDSDQKVSNISHLIRKKRKNPEEDTETECEAKKSKQENGTSEEPIKPTVDATGDAKN